MRRECMRAVFLFCAKPRVYDASPLACGNVSPREVRGDYECECEGERSTAESMMRQ
jgi:hypothetical protein